MTKPIKIAFDQDVVTLPIEKLLPTKALPKTLQQSVKYSRIAASISEVGIIEPLSVARQKGGAYLPLDGHVRLAALREQEIGEAPCIIAHDDESFTYNKRVNRLAVIQEHYMIVRALDRGVSEEKLARALNVDIKVIRNRRHLLRGISDDVAELLKDKQVGHVAFQKLRKMKPLRQLEVAELMVSANNFTSSYAKALLATTKPEDLLNPDEQRKATGLSTEQMERLEREMSELSTDYKELEMSYGDDMLVLVVASGFLERLLGKREIERFLETRHPEILENFRSVVQATSLDQSPANGRAT